MRPRDLSAAAGVVLLALLTACGGGGSSSSGSSGSSGAAGFTITTDSALPGTLQDHAYSATLSAANGSGSLSWSIKPISSTALFVDGLSIDSSTGVLSGTANFGGTAGFIANVSDSASPAHTASKTFTITAAEPLQVPAPQATSVGQYIDISPISPALEGGVFPFHFSLGGSLPPGLRFDPATGQISGSPTALGIYAVSVIIQDSFSPAEVVSEQLTITVVPPPLSVANSLPSRMLQNRPFNGRVIATGGIPPYQLSLVSGSLPPGLSPVDPNSGQTNGTPTALGVFSFTVHVTDSSSPPQGGDGSSVVTVALPLGRNDTVATATPIGNGVISASISPYIDPPGNAPVAADGDYYKLVSLAGASTPVHLETAALEGAPGAPLDTVMEIVDGNGNRYSTCRQPGDTAPKFTSSCINDDIGGATSSLNSALDFQVPGAASSATTFYAHVVDWRGNARPDMNYSLVVSGIASPLSITATPLIPAARGLSYSQQLSSVAGMGNVSWTLAAGSGLPPGLGLDSSGAIVGVATTDGSYSFGVRATDSSSPAQTTTAQETIQVVEPISITSAAIWPDACVNQPYSFAVQTTGGASPLFRGFSSSNWVGISLDQSTGIFSGFSTVTGTFQGIVSVFDATTHGISQHVTLIVKQCP
jgi:large repetitive protein